MTREIKWSCCSDPCDFSPAFNFIRIPEELGRAVDLRVQNGRVVVSTESGIETIIPVPRD
jgi:hypothetical protein